MKMHMAHGENDTKMDPARTAVSDASTTCQEETGLETDSQVGLLDIEFSRNPHPMMILFRYLLC